MNFNSFWFHPCLLSLITLIIGLRHVMHQLHCSLPTVFSTPFYSSSTHDNPTHTHDGIPEPEPTTPTLDKLNASSSSLCWFPSRRGPLWPHPTLVQAHPLRHMDRTQPPLPPRRSRHPRLRLQQPHVQRYSRLRRPPRKPRTRRCQPRQQWHSALRLWPNGKHSFHFSY